MSAPDHERACARMLETIQAEARDTRRWTGRDGFSAPVMAAMKAVPRHAFVAPGDEDAAYVNRPRPIGHGQTISQPYIVALMTELLDLTPESRVLEIGTGCGYQAAVLAEIAAEVYSIESVPELAESARERLARLGYANVRVREGDGFKGWPEAAPFDGIIVTAAPASTPRALFEQLVPGGRLVIPLGRAYETQMLTRIVKREDGTADETGLLPVAFVPMLHPRDRAN